MGIGVGVAHCHLVMTEVLIPCDVTRWDGVGHSVFRGADHSRAVIVYKRFVLLSCPACWCSGQKEVAFVVFVSISWHVWAASIPSASSGKDEAEEKGDLGAPSSFGPQSPF